MAKTLKTEKKKSSGKVLRTKSPVKETKKTVASGRKKTTKSPAAAGKDSESARDAAGEVSIAVPRERAVPATSESRSYDGNTAYNLYLQEIARTELLTPAEEISLAKRVQRGDKKAREKMIKANLRLVVKIAREYEHYGLPLLDLINEGNIGLMKAVERFDPSKGAKLSTYGALWIKQAIRRALANQAKTIRLPVHMVDKISKMRRIVLHYQEEFGREPTDDELGAELGISVYWVVQMRNASIRPASLDAPMGDDDKTSFAEIVADDKMSTAYEDLDQKTMAQTLRELIGNLDQREATILRYRFGLDGGDEKTLEEVGQEFGVTRERIRQLQNIALNKLRKRLEERDRSAVQAA